MCYTVKMDHYEIKMLRQEIQALRAQLDDLTKAQNNDRAEAIKAINEVHKEKCEDVTKIHVLLWPLIHKIFPNFAATNQQIDAILAPGGDRKNS